MSGLFLFFFLILKCAFWIISPHASLADVGLSDAAENEPGQSRLTSGESEGGGPRGC